MKRLYFNQIDNTKITTNDVFCNKDILKGEIILSDKIYWYLYDSINNIVAKGISTSVAYAQKAIKTELINQGALFTREHRKYKI